MIMTSLFLLSLVACGDMPTLADHGEMVVEGGAFINEAYMISGSNGRVQAKIESTSNNCAIILDTAIRQSNESYYDSKPLLAAHSVKIEGETEVNVMIKCKKSLDHTDDNGVTYDGEMDVEKIKTKVTIKYLVD